MPNKQNTTPAAIVVVYTRACDACGSSRDIGPDDYVCAGCKARIAARRMARLTAELNAATVVASNPTRAGWGL